LVPESSLWVASAPVPLAKMAVPANIIVTSARFIAIRFTVILLVSPGPLFGPWYEFH
jgi:hypothetical protein